jgi:HlyD family secretion protein
VGNRERTVIAVACGIVLVGVVSARRGDDLEMTTAQVTHGAVVRQILATGSLKPAKAVAVGAQLSGTLQSIEADFNSRVRAGQVLARLDPALYRSQLLNAQARLAQAEAARSGGQVALEDAREKLARAEQLAGQDLIPQTELDAARTNRKLAEAALTAAEAGIAEARALVTEARVSLDHTIIRSPVDGIVVSRHVDIGQTIAASAQTPVLFEVADLRHMQLLAEISEADVSGVQAGSVVTFQVEALGDQSFEGTVSSVRLQPVQPDQPAVATSGNTQSATPPSAAPAAPPAAPVARPAPQPAAQPTAAAPATGVVSYTAVIDVHNVAGRLMPGGTAIVVMDGASRQDVIRIPSNALSFRPSSEVLEAVGQKPPVTDTPAQSVGQAASRGPRRAYVWKFENREFVPIPVETGLSDDRWTELVSGSLRPGDTLVTAAAPKGGGTR